MADHVNGRMHWGGKPRRSSSWMPGTVTDWQRTVLSLRETSTSRIDCPMRWKTRCSSQARRPTGEYGRRSSRQRLSRGRWSLPSSSL